MKPLLWSRKGIPVRGTLAEYIAEHYPLYGSLGLKNWEQVFNYIKKAEALKKGHP